jgi:isopenicillin N synthase-like dioxygenase
MSETIPSIVNLSQTDAIERACRSWGAFYCPLPPAMMDATAAAYGEMTRFFAQPADIKLRERLASATMASQIANRLAQTPRIGYLPPTERAPKETYSYALGHGNATYDAYCDQASALGHEILRLVAPVAKCELVPPYCETLSLVHYPVFASNDDAPRLGLGAHTDWGYLSILASDAPGLQVQCRTTGLWVNVPSLPGHALVHLGDALEFETGGALVSPVHRVLAPRPGGGERAKHSLVMFFEPALTTRVGETGNVTYGDFLQAKLNK